MRNTDIGQPPEPVIATVVIRSRDEADVDGVVLAPADEEFRVALRGRQQHLVQRGHGAVVQEWRRGPHAFERSRLVAGDLLRQVERATYEAYRKMLAAAIEDLKLSHTPSGELSPNEKYFKIISAFRKLIPSRLGMSIVGAIDRLIVR